MLKVKPVWGDLVMYGRRQPFQNTDSLVEAREWPNLTKAWSFKQVCSLTYTPFWAKQQHQCPWRQCCPPPARRSSASGRRTASADDHTGSDNTNTGDHWRRAARWQFGSRCPTPQTHPPRLSAKDRKFLWTFTKDKQLWRPGSGFVLLSFTEPQHLPVQSQNEAHTGPRRHSSPPTPKTRKQQVFTTYILFLASKWKQKRLKRASNLTSETLSTLEQPHHYLYAVKSEPGRKLIFLVECFKASTFSPWHKKSPLNLDFSWVIHETDICVKVKH